MTSRESAATVIRSGFVGRLAEALMFSAAVALPAWLIGRGSDTRPVIYGIGAVLVALILAAFLRPDARVVSDQEIRLRKKTVRRAEVVRVTSSGESTALVFRGSDDGVVALYDPMGRSQAFREALRRHGWPEVERGA